MPSPPRAAGWPTPWRAPTSSAIVPSCPGVERCATWRTTSGWCSGTGPRTCAPATRSTARAAELTPLPVDADLQAWLGWCTYSLLQALRDGRSGRALLGLVAFAADGGRRGPAPGPGGGGAPVGRGGGVGVLPPAGAGPRRRRRSGVRRDHDRHGREVPARHGHADGDRHRDQRAGGGRDGRRRTRAGPDGRAPGDRVGSRAHALPAPAGPRRGRRRGPDARGRDCSPWPTRRDRAHLPRHGQLPGATRAVLEQLRRRRLGPGGALAHGAAPPAPLRIRRRRHRGRGRLALPRRPLLRVAVPAPGGGRDRRGPDRPRGGAAGHRGASGRHERGRRGALGHRHGARPPRPALRRGGRDVAGGRTAALPRRRGGPRAVSPLLRLPLRPGRPDGRLLGRHDPVRRVERTGA